MENYAIKGSKKKKKTLLWLILIIVLIVLVGGIILFINFPKKNITTHHSSSVNLATSKTEKISQIKRQMRNFNLTENALVQKLQKEQLLPLKETNWENYLSANSLSELENKSQKIFTLLTQLKNSPSPTPVPKPNGPVNPTGPSEPETPSSPQPEPSDNPNPPTPSPNPTPQPNPTPKTPPTDQWDKKLSEFRNYWETDLSPLISQLTKKEDELRAKNGRKEIFENSGIKAVFKSLDEEEQNEYQKLFQESRQKVENFLAQNQTLEPLSGVDLAGVGKEELRNLSHSGPVPEIASSTRSDINKYRDWVYLNTPGDGNCFLNSFSILLTGQVKKDLVIQLRLALILDLMKDFFSKHLSTEEELFGTMKSYFDFYHFQNLFVNYASISDLCIWSLARILRRNLFLICIFSTGSYADNVLVSSPLYPETWVIYCTSNHAQPLIEKDW